MPARTRGRLSCQAVIRVPAARDSSPPIIGSGASPPRLERRASGVSRPCAARRRARRRSRGGTARARRPTPRRGRRRSSRWSSNASPAGDLHRVADAVLADHDVAGGVGLRVVDAETRRVQPAAAVAARASDPRSPRSAGAPSRGSPSRAPRRCRPCPPSRTPRAGCRRGPAGRPSRSSRARPRARPTAHSRCGHNARGAE